MLSRIRRQPLRPSSCQFASYHTIPSHNTWLATPVAHRKSVKDITRKLLKIKKSKRLGNTAGGAKSVMNHKWFSGFDWDKLLKRQLEAPINPNVSNPSARHNVHSQPSSIHIVGYIMTPHLSLNALFNRVSFIRRGFDGVLV